MVSAVKREVLAVSAPLRVAHYKHVLTALGLTKIFERYLSPRPQVHKCSNNTKQWRTQGRWTSTMEAFFNLKGRKHVLVLGESCTVIINNTLPFILLSSSFFRRTNQIIKAINTKSKHPPHLHHIHIFFPYSHSIVTRNINKERESLLFSIPSSPHINHHPIPSPLPYSNPLNLRLNSSTAIATWR